jgi:hypothetical protein
LHVDFNPPCADAKCLDDFNGLDRGPITVIVDEKSWFGLSRRMAATVANATSVLRSTEPAILGVGDRFELSGACIFGLDAGHRYHHIVPYDFDWI